MQNSTMKLIHHPRLPADAPEAHLASLRRHAEAMSGSRESADAYVAAVMDILALDSNALPDASSVKVGLFKLYTRLYAHLLTQGQPFQAQIRQILLLTLMEGFSKKETAEILDVSMAEVVTILKFASGATPDAKRSIPVGHAGKGRPSYRPIRKPALEVAC